MFNVGIIKINQKNYSLGATFFLSLFTFFFEFAQFFSICFATRITKIGKFETKKKKFVGEKALYIVKIFKFF